jgi:hypothetical protein
VVSRLLCMQKASGSNPDESSFAARSNSKSRAIRRIRSVNNASRTSRSSNDTLAEWLRRRPAKPVCSARVGSNPTGVDSLFDRSGSAWSAWQKCMLVSSYSSVGQSVRLITVRSAVQARVGAFVLFSCIQRAEMSKPSDTGTRTRVSWVRAKYPNQLDYIGA